jgi:predicted transcriptional regulator
MLLKDFKKGKLIFSSTAKNSEDLAKKISEKVYYNSVKKVTCFEVGKKFLYFYLVDKIGNVKRDKIIQFDKKTGRFQYRYFNL